MLSVLLVVSFVNNRNKIIHTQKQLLTYLLQWMYPSICK
jgi:hypothetical protein